MCKGECVTAGLTVLPPQSLVWSKEIICGSCSPHGSASCLLEMLGAFLSDALSAEAGLYLWSLCQGEYGDRAKLVKKLLVNLTMCGYKRDTQQCYAEKQSSSFEAQCGKKVKDSDKGKKHSILHYRQLKPAFNHLCHSKLTANTI